MGSFIQTDSIFIDLTDSSDNTDTEKCEHFSLRGYVSNMRKVDWRKCWPFPLKDSKEQPSFPKLEEPKFKWWACQNCRQAIKVQGTDNKDERTHFDCCNTRRGSDSNFVDATITTGIQQDPTLDSSFVRRDIDLNIPIIDLSSDNDGLPIDFEIGLENNLNLQVSSIPSPDVGPDLAQQVHTKKRGRFSGIQILSSTTSLQRDKKIHGTHDLDVGITCKNAAVEMLRWRGRENDEVSDVEPLATNTINEHPTRHLPPESVACSDVELMGNTDNNVKEDIMDHRPSKSTSLSRKKRQKTRLISDLLRENREPELEQTTKVHESASHPPTDASVDSQTLAILQDIVDVQEDTPTKERGRGSDGVSVFEPLARNLNNEDPMRHLPPESIACSDVVPTGNNNNIVKEDILDHYPSKSTSLSRKKRQKMRSIGDLLSKNQDPGTEQTTRVHESTSHPPTNASADSERLPVLPNKVDVQEDITLAKMAHGRKRKFLSNEKSKRRSEIDIQNREGDAKTIDTIPETRAEEFCNKNSIHQIKKQLSFSLPLQEGTSKHQPIKKESEISISRVFRRIANDTRGKGKGVHIEEINGAKNKAKTAEVMRELGGMRTMEDSEQDTINDIPMDVVEFMTKMQYERSLPHVENKTGLLEESTHKESGNIIREKIVLSENGKSINLERRDKQVKKRDKQVKKRNINLNHPKSNGLGNLRSTNAESLMDTNKQSTTPFNAVVGAQMLQRAFNHPHCNNKLKIGSLKSGQNVTKSEKGGSSKPTIQNGASMQFNWHNRHKINLKELANRMSVRGSQETPGPSNNIYPNVCIINRNPADVTVVEERNASMINGEDMIFEENVPEERPGLPAPRGSNSKRNLKGKKKEHQNH